VTGALDQLPAGIVVGSFRDYDGLVDGLRARAASVGLSYELIEDLAEMSSGALSKYLSDLRVKQLTVASLIRITAVMGVRCVFVIDDELLREMRPYWELRDAGKAHARRRASLGRATIERLLPVAFSEFAKLGAAARNAKLTAHGRKRLARRAAKARWSKKP
jgi:transcriptional regulator with XRE-family HTH domain